MYGENREKQNKEKWCKIIMPREREQNLRGSTVQNIILTWRFETN